MVFTGPPAAINAANPVINNLDLEVTAPGNTVYRGNVFTSGQSSTGGAADAKNNVEVVMLNAPTVGQYTLTVKGTAVNQSRQGYALVATGAIQTCAPASITSKPSDQSVRTRDPVTMSVAAAGTGTLGYQWYKDNNPIQNANNSTYSIGSAQQSDAGDYTCTVTNSCGTDTSAPATLTVTCRSDFDGDGFVAGPDFDAFVTAFEAGLPSTDYDADGFITGADFDLFVQDFQAGC
jgi:hypothetical protein